MPKQMTAEQWRDAARIPRRHVVEEGLTDLSRESRDLTAGINRASDGEIVTLATDSLLVVTKKRSEDVSAN